MSTSANPFHAFVVNDIEAWCKELDITEYKTLIETCKNLGYSELIEGIEEDEEVKKIYHVLQFRFKAMTGLELHTDYHYMEDDNDGVNGTFWYLANVVQYTEAAKNHLKRFKEKTWISYS